MLSLPASPGHEGTDSGFVIQETSVFYSSEEGQFITMLPLSVSPAVILSSNHDCGHSFWFHRLRGINSILSMRSSIPLSSTRGPLHAVFRMNWWGHQIWGQSFWFHYLRGIQFSAPKKPFTNVLSSATSPVTLTSLWMQIFILASSS